VLADAGFRDTAAGDYRLLPCSPGVQAGDTDAALALGIATDLAGNARVQDGVVDIGAYELPALSTDAVVTAWASCASAQNGWAGFALPNGCPPYAYAWSAGGATGSDTSGLAPGLYAFTVTDLQGRSLVQAVTVQQAPPLEVELAVTQASCATCADGSLGAVVFSGAGPYAYAWSNGSTLPVATGLAPGAYAVTVADVWGCDTVLQAVVSYDVSAGSVPGQSAVGGSVTPNPANEGVVVHWGDDAQWLLVHADGRVVRRVHRAGGSSTAERASLAGVAPGAYASVFTDEAGRVTSRTVLVVVR
jgi:hypothetical protein